VTAERWTVEISTEVARWYGSLKDADRAFADVALERLRDHGPALRMPHSRSLSGGLFELRFSCEGVARRITYHFDAPRRAITLTTFRKQRQADQREMTRARRAMKKSQAERER
jgi:hypothetical protein